MSNLDITDLAPTLPDQKAPTPWQALKRREKAERLAHTLFVQHISSGTAAGMNIKEWWLLAVAAGVRIPSSETRAMTVEILKQKEEEHEHRDR